MNPSDHECPRCAQIDILEEQIKVLREIIGLALPAPPVLKLTPMEAKIYSILVKREFITRKSIEEILYSLKPDCDRPKHHSVLVAISRIRKKIAPYGITILSLGSGRGENRYWMTVESKQNARALMQMQFSGEGEHAH